MCKNVAQLPPPHPTQPKFLYKSEYVMSDNSWKKRQQALEDEYFRKENEAALKRLGERGDEKPRLSPIDGQPMEQVTMMGVVIDRCKTSGGIWLDAGELDELMAAYKTLEKNEEGEGWAETFFSFFKGANQD